MESIALVTGASRGIGRAIALELGQEGRCVCVNYYQHAEAAQEVVRQLQARGCRAMAVQADVADRTAVEHMIHTITDTWGPVDLLVNNAGISLQGLFQDTTDEQWDRILGVNLTGPRNTIQAVLPAMISAKQGWRWSWPPPGSGSTPSPRAALKPTWYGCSARKPGPCWWRKLPWGVWARRRTLPTQWPSWPPRRPRSSRGKFSPQTGALSAECFPQAPEVPSSAAAVQPPLRRTSPVAGMPAAALRRSL